MGSYLAYQADRFGERFDANSYITLSMAMDLFDLGSTPEVLTRSLHETRCRWLVISYTSDWLFPPFQSRQIVDALLAANRPVSYCNVESSCGHDAFLLPDEIATYGTLIAGFLANLLAKGRRGRLAGKRGLRAQADQHLSRSSATRLRIDCGADSGGCTGAGSGMWQRRPAISVAGARSRATDGPRTRRAGRREFRPPRAGRGASRLEPRLSLIRRRSIRGRGALPDPPDGHRCPNRDPRNAAGRAAGDRQFSEPGLPQTALNSPSMAARRSWRWAAGRTGTTRTTYDS